MQCVEKRQPINPFFDQKRIYQPDQQTNLINQIIRQLQISIAYNKQAIQEKRKRQKEIWNLSSKKIHRINQEIYKYCQLHQYDESLLDDPDLYSNTRILQFRTFEGHTNDSLYLAIDVVVYRSERNQNRIMIGTINRKVGGLNNRRSIIFSAKLNSDSEPELKASGNIAKALQPFHFEPINNMGDLKITMGFIELSRDSDDKITGYRELAPRYPWSQLIYFNNADEICLHLPDDQEIEYMDNPPDHRQLVFTGYQQIIPDRLTDLFDFSNQYYFNPTFLQSDQSKYNQKLVESVSDGVTITKYKSNITLDIEAHKITTITDERIIVKYYQHTDDEELLIETAEVYFEDNNHEIIYREWTIHVDNTTLGLGNIFTKFKSLINRMTGKNRLESLTVNKQDDDHHSYDLTIGPVGEVLVANGKIKPTETYGFKAVVGPYNEKLLALLKIPSSATVASSSYSAGKLRTNLVEVIEFYQVDVQEVFDHNEIIPTANFILFKSDIDVGYSFVHQEKTGFEYHKDTTIEIKDFYHHLDDICVPGIHYHLDAESALEFHAFGMKIGNVDQYQQEELYQEEESYDEESYLLKKKNQ